MPTDQHAWKSYAHALVRNSIMCALSADDYYDRLAWLYGGTGGAS